MFKLASLQPHPSDTLPTIYLLKMDDFFLSSLQQCTLYMYKMVEILGVLLNIELG